MDAAVDSAIRRKLAGNRVGRAPFRGIEEIGENFAKLLDERLRGLMRTLTSAIVIDCEVKKLSSVLEEIPVPAMIAVIDVKGSQNSALMNVGMDLIYHVVDLRMGGDPAAAPMPVARSVTAIDCALCEDFIRLGLEAFEAALRVHLGPGIRAAMKLDHFEQHVTMVRIAPEHSDVLVLRISLDMGEAARASSTWCCRWRCSIPTGPRRRASSPTTARAPTSGPGTWRRPPPIRRCVCARSCTARSCAWRSWRIWSPGC